MTEENCQQKLPKNQIANSSQWRIQDFSEGVRQFSNWDYFVHFGRKLHENERIWILGATLAPPVDPPMVSVYIQH